MLAVQAAGRNWLVDTADISEALPLPPLTPVPFAKPWLRGVANVRGSLYCVTDLAAFLGLGAASGEAGNRVLLLADRDAHAALLVDRVLGLREVEGWTQSEADGEVRYCDEQGESWRKLDVPGLLGQPAFLHIAVEEA
jgi:twitching motility protein PilI